MRQERKREVREVRNVRDSDWNDTNVLWVPPQFEARMKSAGMRWRWLRFKEGTDKPDRRLPQRLHRGWQFVKPADIPEWKEPPTADFGKFESLIAVGDLALAICPLEKAEEDQAYAEERAEKMQLAVREQLMMHNHRAMPITDDTKISTGRQAKFAD